MSGGSFDRTRLFIVLVADMDLHPSTDIRETACHEKRLAPISMERLPRVLLVEDEAKLRESLMEGLQLENWRVVGAGTVAEARILGSETEFDLIVLDWMLPDGDGLQFVRLLRSQGKRMPILMVSARGGAAAREHVIAAGANDYLPKPFSFGDLLARAQALLDAERATPREP